MERRGKFKAANPEAESYLAQSRFGGSRDSEAIPYRTCEREGCGTCEFEWQRAEPPSRLIRGGCSELHQGTRFGSNVGPYSLSPQGYVQNVYQAVENVSYIRGKHTFKFGVEGRNYITETTSLPRARGEWDYASLNSLINDFVPDGANGALRGAGTASSANNNPADYWFVQDDWKVLPRLTVNLGF